MDKRTEQERRESFRQINANCAIEGQVMNEADLAVQERVIRGEVTHDEAVTEVCQEFGVPKQP